MEKTLESPDKIIDNPKSFGRATHASARKADERYIKYFPDLKQHVIVPVAKIDGGTVIASGSTLTVQARDARSAYTSDQVPVARVFWSST